MTLRNCKEKPWQICKNPYNGITNLQRIAFWSAMVKSVSIAIDITPKTFIVNCKFVRWVGCRSVIANFSSHNHILCKLIIFLFCNAQNFTITHFCFVLLDVYYNWIRFEAKWKSWGFNLVANLSSRRTPRIETSILGERIAKSAAGRFGIYYFERSSLQHEKCSLM